MRLFATIATAIFLSAAGTVRAEAPTPSRGSVVVKPLLSIDRTLEESRKDYV